MVLLGQPGSGKSTFARHVAIGMARALLGTGTLRKQLPGWKGGKALLPVFVPLGRLAVGFPKHAETGSADWVAAFIRDQVNGRQELAGYGDGLLHQLADAGGLVIFDGLDEVPGQQRKPVKEAVQGFAALHRGCKILVTCRTHSYLEDRDRRVLRGGSWAFARSGCRGAARIGGVPDSGVNFVGFRCCVATSSLGISEF
jgi:predicted NACHT family NTPase